MTESHVIEKRSSFRGWKERNKGKSNQNQYIIGIAASVLIVSILIIYPYLDRKENVSGPAINVNSSTVTNNSP
jgi:quinol-cytochrome oxidoreductase complex cytochrome b subunit